MKCEALLCDEEVDPPGGTGELTEDGRLINVKQLCREHRLEYAKYLFGRKTLGFFPKDVVRFKNAEPGYLDEEYVIEELEVASTKELVGLPKPKYPNEPLLWMRLRGLKTGDRLSVGGQPSGMEKVVKGRS